jgi:hypothetical protein
MSLPSGLLFYLDYTYGNDAGPYSKGQSIYGQPSGRDIQGGADAVGGQYDLAGAGFSRRHVVAAEDLNEVNNVIADGSYGADGVFAAGAVTGTTIGAKDKSLLQHDPQILDLLEAGSKVSFLVLDLESTGFIAAGSKVDRTMVRDMAIPSKKTVGTVLDQPATLEMAGSVISSVSGIPSSVQQDRAFNIRRLNQLGTWANGEWTADPINGQHVLVVLFRQAIAAAADSGLWHDLNEDAQNLTESQAIVADAQAAEKALDVPTKDDLLFSYVMSSAQTVGSESGEVDFDPAFESNMAEQGGGAISPTIPEIDIKIESISVIA